MITAKTNDTTISANLTAGPVAVVAHRITSIDLLRGVVMIIMTLDHVRDYFHADVFFYEPTDLSQTNVYIFFTRWITHFCAPVFIFLAGTSAFLSSQKKTRQELSLFLIKRGLWLIFLELTIVNFAWMFDITFSNFDLAVIWALGGSMIVLAGFIYLPFRFILITGIVLVFGHNFLDSIKIEGMEGPAFLWGILHQAGGYKILETNIFVTYPILPWVGVMALGYCFGQLYIKSMSNLQRKKILISLGGIAILMFFILRLINIYGDPSQWAVQEEISLTILSFFNVSKYPPSLLFLLITLGPVFLFLTFAEKPLNRLTDVISTFGRVPLFFYLLHLYLIHLLAMAAAEFTGFDWTDMVLDVWVTESPGLDGYGFSLGMVYLIWLIIVVILHPVCLWYDRYKLANKQKWWLSYL